MNRRSLSRLRGAPARVDVRNAGGACPGNADELSSLGHVLGVDCALHPVLACTARRCGRCL
jgi:hypothetical protein